MDKKFDHKIKQVVEQIEAKYENKYWNSFEGKLLEEGLLSPDQMTPELTPESSTANPSSQGSDWDSFSQMLSASESHHFDKKVKEKIEDYEASQSSSNWDRLHKQMVLRDAKDKSIFYNVIKVAAVLLLFVLGYKSIETMQESKSVQEFTESYLEQLKKLPDAITNTPIVKTIVAQKKETKKSVKADHIPTQKLLASNTGFNKNIDVDFVRSLDGRELSSHADIYSTLPSSTELELIDDSSSSLESSATDLESYFLPYSPGKKTRTTVFTTLPENEYTGELNLISSTKSRSTPKTKLGFYSTASMDEIDATLSNYSDKRKENLAVSNGFGAEIEYSKGKGGIRVGTEYKKLDYETNNTSLQVVNVPVEYRFNAAQTHNSKLYALAGVEGHFTVASEYESLNRNNEEVKDGLLFGGDWNQNSYASANAGLGFEQNLTENVSLFGEAIYKNAIGRKYLTENQDVPNNTVMLKVGARYHFE